jgi:hypothetical protein
VKPQAQARIALVFPDLYELGMSNNALRTLYHIVNSDERWAAERSYAPWPDLGRLMMDAEVPLYSLETFRPLCDFEVVGITLQTELNYTNVPYVLDLAHIPIWAAERGESDPIVVGGGPCMTNPEPVAPFFDAFVIGDGEILVRAIMELATRRAAGEIDRGEMLRQLAGLPGMYVPSLLEFEMGPQGDLLPVGLDGNGPYGRAKGVKRTWVEVLDPKDAAIRVPAPQRRRSCTSASPWSFCADAPRDADSVRPGYWYRPIRELSPDAVDRDLAKAGHRGHGSGRTGTSVAVHRRLYPDHAPWWTGWWKIPAFRHVNLSLPSLRANMFGQALARKVARARGSRSGDLRAGNRIGERLRKVINKTITDQDMYRRRRRRVRQRLAHSIKLYTMIGIAHRDHRRHGLVLRSSSNGLARKVGVKPHPSRGRSTRTWGSWCPSPSPRCSGSPS